MNYLYTFNMKYKNRIYISSGKYKLLKLKINKKIIIRPTLNKIKKILFNWLYPFITNSYCLDCFTGTGALSIESLSLGAKHITMIEKNYKNIKYLIKNTHTLLKHQYTIINKDIIKWLNQTYIHKQYQIIFLDPPYKYKKWNILLSKLEKYNLLTKNALIYIETNQNINTFEIPHTWSIYKTKQYGKYSYNLYKNNLL